MLFSTMMMVFCFFGKLLSCVSLLLITWKSHVICVSNWFFFHGVVYICIVVGIWIYLLVMSVDMLADCCFLHYQSDPRFRFCLMLMGFFFTCGDHWGGDAVRSIWFGLYLVCLWSLLFEERGLWIWQVVDFVLFVVKICSWVEGEFN